jgi:hypothetical protein
MAAPVLSGITINANFSSVTNGTLVASAAASSYANTYVGAGVNGNNALGMEQSGQPTGTGTYQGVRFTPTNFGVSGSPTTMDFSSAKLIIYLSEMTNAGSPNTALATKANRGVIFRLYSNAGFTQYAEWILWGSDANWGVGFRRKSLGYGITGTGWAPLVLDVGNASTLADSTSSFTPSTIYAFEFRTCDASGTLGGFYCSMLLSIPSGSGTVLTAGDVGTPGKFSNLSTYTETTVGAFLTFSAVSSYIFRTPILIGDGSTATRFDDSDLAIQWIGLDSTSANPRLTILQTNYLGLTVNQSASDYFRVQRCLFTAPDKWQLTISGSTSATFIWSGGSISNVGTNSLGGSASFTGVTFSGSNRLNPTTGRSFISCTITTSTDSVAALDWVSGIAITGTSFTNNTTPTGAIRINAAGTYTLDKNTFSGNTKLFNITATTGTVTIVQDSGTTFDVSFNASCYVTAGATVVLVPYVPSVQVGVSGAPIGASIGIFKSTGSGSVIADRAQFTLASGNNSGNSTLVISSSIPNDTPTAGFVRIVRADGTEDRLQYASWSGSTFTLSGGVTLPISYSAGLGCYVGYLDVINSLSGTESNTIKYVADRFCVYTVLKGSGTGKINPIRQSFTLQNQDSVIPVAGVLDSINTR